MSDGPANEGNIVNFPINSNMTEDAKKAYAEVALRLMEEAATEKAKEDIDLNGPGIIHPADYRIMENAADPDDAILHFIEKCNLWLVFDKTTSHYVSIGLQDTDSENEEVSMSAMGTILHTFSYKFAGVKGFKPKLTLHSTLNREKRILVMQKEGSRKILKLAVNTNKWVKPRIALNRNPHKFFDILLDCLSGEDHRFKEHLEMCILQKLFFPEDHLIPCIVWSDPGGTGKTQFVDKLLNTIFAGQTISNDAKWIFDTRSNGQIAGKVVILADDADKMSEDELNAAKRQIHNNQLTVRFMKGNPNQIKNVAWFIIASNTKNVIEFKGGAADRRWSVINLGYDNLESKSLPYQIQKNLGLKTRREAEDYEAKNFPVLSNKEEISYWLGELVLRHGIPAGMHSMKNDGYHEESYHDQVKRNRKRDIYTKTFDLVFMARGFTSAYVLDVMEFHLTVNGISKEKYDIGSFGELIREYLKEYQLTKVWGSNDGPGIPSKSDGRMRYYRYNADSVRVDNKDPVPKVYGNKDAFNVILERLYDELNKQWADLIPKQEVYYNKNVWSVSEINSVLKQQHEDDFNQWDGDRNASEIDQFLCHIRDIRSIIANEIDAASDIVDVDDGAAHYRNPEIIECYFDRNNERMYRFTTRVDTSAKPTFPTDEWARVPNLIDKWIASENPESDSVYEMKILKYCSTLLEQTHLDVDEITNLKWMDCQKMYKTDLPAQEWLKVYELPNSGEFLATFKVFNPETHADFYSKIVFGMENVVNEMFKWRGECKFADEDDYVFCLTRGSGFDLKEAFYRFTNHFDLHPN